MGIRSAESITQAHQASAVLIVGFEAGRRVETRRRWRVALPPVRWSYWLGLEEPRAGKKAIA
jgi:hypothetical protein